MKNNHWISKKFNILTSNDVTNFMCGPLYTLEMILCVCAFLIFCSSFSEQTIFLVFMLLKQRCPFPNLKHKGKHWIFFRCTVVLSLLLIDFLTSHSVRFSLFFSFSVQIWKLKMKFDCVLVTDGLRIYMTSVHHL